MSSMNEIANRMYQLPVKYNQKISQAVQILREVGCTEVYLFGSLGTGNYHEGSDIDLAVRGCPKGKYFYVLGQLLDALDYKVDLVDLDSKENAFAQHLQNMGRLVKIA